jgi:hypothetical protein
MRSARRRPRFVGVEPTGVVMGPDWASNIGSAAARDGSVYALDPTRCSFAIAGQSHSQHYGFNKSDDADKAA